MQRQHTGRPGTIVIPASWGRSHASIVEATLNTTVRIGPAGGATAWNDGRGQSETVAAAAVYVGPATVMAVSDSARALTVVEDPIKSRVYDVTLPYDNTSDTVTGDPDAALVGHVITIDSAVVDGTDPDPELATRQLRIEAIERGSRRFSRVLLAVLVD